MAVIGQTKIDSLKKYIIGSGLKYEGGELVPTPGNSDTLKSSTAIYGFGSNGFMP